MSKSLLRSHNILNTTTVHIIHIKKSAGIWLGAGLSSSVNGPQNILSDITISGLSGASALQSGMDFDPPGNVRLTFFSVLLHWHAHLHVVVTG